MLHKEKHMVRHLNKTPKNQYIIYIMVNGKINKKANIRKNVDKLKQV